MKAPALVLSAFVGFPSNPIVAAPFPPPSTIEWPDSSLHSALLDIDTSDSDDLVLPETSAVDDVSSDLAWDGDPGPHYVLAGCELALEESLARDDWARDFWLGAPRPLIVENGHTERDGQWLEYEQIPRRAERPKPYEAYLYPLADVPVVSGYDLDKPDDEQRRGRMRAIGHGGVDLVADIGTPIAMVRLEHQLGEAEVVYVGPLYGETVVTRHVLREGGVDHDYVLLFGHLDHAADDVRRGQRLREGATVGFVGNSDSPELVHLHLEARRMRDGKDAWRVPGALLNAREYSVVTDPRNVLPLRAPRLPTPRCVPHLTGEARRYWLGDAWTLRLE
jgi:hypothetical protein